MTIADSRVVASVCLVTERWPHFVSAELQVFDNYEPSIGDKFVLESLLAEAESALAACNELSGRRLLSLFALQSRLDAVLGWAAEIENYLADRSDVVDGDYGQPAPNAEMKLLQELTDLRTTNRSAALGGESPANDEVENVR